MSDHLTVDDYPLSEKRPDLVRGQRGKKLADVTLDAVMQGDIQMQDLRITREALLMQAQIARAANRPTLAQNFERAAELVQIPQDFLMHVYELLRPGRCKSKGDLMEAARQLREAHQAEKMAAFVEEAADVYERRGLFTYRF
jgi:propanediol dehydratase small subunit